jgi:hypothetical protein
MSSLSKDSDGVRSQLTEDLNKGLIPPSELLMTASIDIYIKHGQQYQLWLG